MIERFFMSKYDEALTRVIGKGNKAIERITGKSIEQFQAERTTPKTPTAFDLAIKSYTEQYRPQNFPETQYHDVPDSNYLKDFSLGAGNAVIRTGQLLPTLADVFGTTLVENPRNIVSSIMEHGSFHDGILNADVRLSNGTLTNFLKDELGYDPTQTQEIINSAKSKEWQRQSQVVEEAKANAGDSLFDKSLAGFKASLTNPNILASEAGSLVIDALGGGATTKGMGLAKTASGVAVGEGVYTGANVLSEIAEAKDGKLTGSDLGYATGAGVGTGLLGRAFTGKANLENVLVGVPNPATTSLKNSTATFGKDVGKETLQEYFQTYTEELPKQMAIHGEVDIGNTAFDAGMGAGVGGAVGTPTAGYTLVSDATSKTKNVVNKATNTIKQKLSTPHEELINPNSKKYNPTTAYVNAVAELNRADTDEAKQVAQTKINEATNSVMSVLDGFDTKIANTTNQDEIDNLTAQKQSYIDTYVTPLQNTIQSVKDNAVDVHSDEFYLNLIGSVSKRVNPVVDISQVDTDVINQNQATNITEPTQSQPTSEQVSMKLGGKTYTAILKNDGDGQGEYFEVNTKNGKTKYYHYNEANPNEIVKFGNKEVHKDAVSSLQALSNAYQKQFKQPLTLVSGFRSYDYQQNKNLAGKLSKRTAEDVFTSNAWVGGSKHHTGLAFDFLSTNPNDFKKGGRFYKQGEWLAQNAEKFGLSLSYPKDNKGNVMYEAWEFVYQGTDRAKQLLTPKGANVITKSTSQKQNQTIHASHGFTDTKVRSVKDINHKFRMPFHNVNKSGGNSLFSGGVVKGDTLGFMALLDKDDEIFNASVGFTSITGGRHKKITGNSHGNGYKIDLDLKNGDDVETYARIGQRVADLAKQHGYIVQVNAEKAGWGNIGKRGDVNFINGGGSHLDITVVGRVGSGQGGVVKQSQPINTGNFSINNKELTKSNLMLGTYSAFVKAGFTDGQARYLIGEVNRENEFAIRYLFGTHGDKGNNKTNLGFVSWQGTRKDKLVSYLNQQGIKATHSSIPQTQESLDAMARFLMAEIKQGDITYKKYKGTSYASPNFLNEPNPDRNDHKWGHSIIGWAYGQTKLATGAKFNSKDHEAKLFAGTNRINELLGSNMTSSPINSEQSMNQPTQTQQDELSSQALSLIRELEETNGDNTKRIQELQDELTAVQEQLANINQSEQSNVTEQTTEQVQTEPEANGLDEQVIADVRANQLANITRRFSQRVIESDADYSRALTEINELKKTGIITESEANGFMQLLDVKIRIKGNTTGEVSNQVYNGRKGNSVLETNLGIKDYATRLDLAVANNRNTDDIMANLTRFRDDHVSKANAIRDAINAFNGTSIVIAPNRNNQWQVVDNPSELPANARKYTVSTGRVTEHFQAIFDEAKDLDDFTTAWQNILNGSSTEVPSVPTAPVSNNAPVVTTPTTTTPDTAINTPEPVQSASVAPNTPQVQGNIGVATSHHKMNDPNGVWVGIATDDNNKWISMSALNDPARNVTGIVDGILGSPYSTKGSGTWKVANDKEGEYKYRTLFASNYNKFPFLRDFVESIRGKTLYGRAGGVEARVINELLSATANMTDEQKAKYMESLAKSQNNRAKQAIIAKNKQAKSERDKAEQSQTQQVDNSNNNQEYIPEPPTEDYSDEDINLLLSELNNNENDNVPDVSKPVDVTSSDASTNTANDNKPTAQESKKTTSLLADGITVIKQKLSDGRAELSKGKNKLIEVIHHIPFNDDESIIAHAILKVYPAITISFDNSDADITGDLSKPKDILQSLVSKSTHQLLAVINEDIDDKQLLALKNELDLIIARLNQLTDLSVKEGRIVESLTQDYESLIGLGLRSKTFLSKIETNTNVKSSLFSTLINGIKSFFGIPNKTTVSNLYERLLDVTAKAIEIQAEDSKETGKLSVLTSDKQERIAEVAKPVKEQNVLKAGITQNSEANLVMVKDLVLRIRRYGMAELSRLGIKKPTAKQQEQLEHFMGFEEAFKEALLTSFRAKKDGYLWQDLKQFTNTGTKDNPSFDDNLMTAMAHAVYDLIITNGGASTLTKRQLRSLLGVEPDALIPNHIAKKYRNLGVSINDMTSSLGRAVIRDLGLKQTDDVPAETLTRLEASLGDWLISAMQVADMVHINTLPSGEFNQDKLIAQGKDEEIPESDWLKQTHFVSLSTNDINTQIADISKGTGSYLADVLGVQSRKVYPTLKPNKEVKDKVESTSAKLSAKQKDKLLKAQAEPIVVNQDMLSLVEGLREQDNEFLYDLFQARVPTDEDLVTKHKSKHESVKESAEGNIRDINNFFSFVEGLPSKDTPFYDSIKTAKNSRMHYMSNVVNFQTSKIHRALVELANFKVDIDLSGFDGKTWFDDKGKPKPETLFLRAVFENAEGTEDIFKPILKDMGFDGFTVDKVPSGTFLPIAYEYLTADIKVNNAVLAVRDLQAGKTLSSDQKTHIKVLVDTWGMGANSFRALMEVSNFLTAVENKTTFTTSLGLGSDGVNNGTAIASVLMGIKDNKLLNMVGIFGKSSEFKSYFDTRTDPSVGDYYTGLKPVLEDAIDELTFKDNYLNNAKKAFEVLNTNLKERKTLKAILIPFGYGAGTARLIQSASEQMIKDIYTTMEKIANMDKPYEKEHEFEKLQSNLQVILGNGFKLSEDLLNFTFNDYQLKQLNDVYAKTIGSAIKSAMIAYASEFSDRRSFNIAIHGMAYDAYEILKNKLEREAEEQRIERVKAKYPDAKPNELERYLAYETLTPKERKEWVDDKLAKAFPTIHSSYEHDEEHNGSIELAGTEKTLASDKSVDTVTTVFDGDKGGLINRTRNVLIRTVKAISTGVTANSQMIQGSDSSISSQAMTASDVISINVHDANIGNILHYMRMANEQNKAFFDVTSKYHIYYESLLGLVNTIENLDTLSADEQQQLVHKWIKSLNRDGMLDLNELVWEETDLSHVLTKVTDMLIGKAIDYDLAKISLWQEQGVVHQYAGEGGEYTLTDADYKTLQSQKTKLLEAKEELKERMLNATKSYQGKLGAIEGIHYGEDHGFKNSGKVSKRSFNISEVNLNEITDSVAYAFFVENLKLTDTSSKDQTKAKDMAEYLVDNKGEWQELIDVAMGVNSDVNTDEILDPITITLHSGGAYGADTDWDIVGRKYGIQEVKHYRDGGNQKLSLRLNNQGIKATTLTKEQMQHARDELKKLLGLDLEYKLTDNLTARNYYQVVNAGSVFAIAPLLADKKDVKGGTSIAIKLGKRLAKPTYVWDTNTQKWYRYNPQTKKFEETDTPKITKNFAGVGTRDIEYYDKAGKGLGNPDYFGNAVREKAIKAIEDVYKSSFNVGSVKLAHTQDIYNNLPEKTISGNIIVESVYGQNGVNRAKEIGGIFSLRTTEKYHFGNPFSSDKRLVKRDGLVQTNSIKESVERYIEWVMNSSDERAVWIRETLKSGKLKGKPIIYYKELGEPSHANALDYLINQYDWGNKYTRQHEVADNQDTLPKQYQLFEYILGGFNESIRTTNARRDVGDSQKLLSGSGNNQHVTRQSGVSRPTQLSDINQRNAQSDETVHEKGIENAQEQLLTYSLDGLKNLNSKKYKGLTDFVMEAVEKHNPNITVVVSDEALQVNGNTVPASYDTQANTITIYRPNFDVLSDDDKAMYINHELIHGLVEQSFDNPKLKRYVDKLNNMVTELTAVWHDNQSSYTPSFNARLSLMLTEHLSEFIAYGLTDPEMAKWINDNLSSHDVRAKKGFGDYIKQFLKNVYHAWFGDNPSKGFTDFVKVSQHLFSDHETRAGSPVRLSQIVNQANDIDVVDLFTGLPSGSISTEHNTQLDSLINTFIGGYYKTIGNKALVDLVQGKIKNTALISGLKSSDKEAYVTEALVSVLNVYLTNNAGTLAVNGINKLYGKAQAQFKTAKDLFPNYDKADADEQARLRAIHQAVFNPKNKSADSLAWFMALSVSNEELGKALSNHVVKGERSNNSWFDKFMGVLEQVVNTFNNVFFHSKGKNAKAQIDAYVEGLAKVETKARNGHVDYIQLGYSMAHGGLRRLADKPVRKGVYHTAKFLAHAKYTPSIVKSLAVLTFEVKRNILRNQVMGGNKTELDLIEDINQKINSSERMSLLTNSINEIIGLGKRGLNVDSLIRMTKIVEQYRQTVKDNTYKAIRKQFTRELTKQEKSGITSILLRTDMASLLNHGIKPKDVLAMLDEAKRKKMITDYENKLIDKVGHKDYDMLQQVYSLAYYMATGNSKPNMIKSAEGVAIGLGSDYQTTFDKMDTEIFEIVDVLSSLIALDFKDSKEIKAIQKLADTEAKGLIATLNLHRQLIQKGKADFESNPYNYQKGYIPEIVNPYRKVVYASQDKVDTYKRKGFEIITELKQDDADDTDGRVLMIHPEYQPFNYVSGALDMVDTHHRGTPVYEKGVNDKGIREVNKAHLTIRKANAKQRPSVDNFDRTGNALIPTYDAQGAILDYHYEMNHTSRDTLLERDNSFDELLATLNGGLEFKPEMFRQQKEIAKVIAQDAKQNVSKRPNEYVQLDFNSKDLDVQRVIRMIPYSFRAELQKQFGKNAKSYPIHKSMYTATFGYQAYSVVTIWDKLDNNNKLNLAENLIRGTFEFFFKDGRKRALQAERIIQDTMTLIKDMIVVRSGGVLLGNILSNTYLLMSLGINPVRILKDMTFSWRNSKNYRTAVNRIEEINALLMTTKSTKEKSLLNREKKQLQESLNRNPMKEYMEAGLMSTIVEDLTKPNETSYKTELQKKVDSYVDLIPKPINNAINEATLGDGSVLHNFLSEATQFSDLSAKYTLAKYLQENGTSKEKAIYEAQLSFINYDIPTNQFLDYMNRMGLMMFTKFFLRFQRVMVKLAYNAPVSSLIGHYAVEYMGGQGVYDPFWLNRLGNPLESSVFNLPNTMGEVISVNMLL
ncbi:M15 family metallopeptidase [Moraxella bovis]|uniref:M15 family metallopeptidase n=1 Tax=Moraxella bovis TaxID=476 RepID=UPI002225D758|nr:M15 family metallopeptidase [Moraxella bovis]UZA57385.1 M15 family metallopeptidase [Moraxella bovis]